MKLELRRKITAEEIKQFFPKNCAVYCKDPAYNATSLESMKSFCFLWKKFIKYFKWTTRRDCDNFAGLFKNNIINFIFNPTIAIGTLDVERGPNNLHELNCFFHWDQINGLELIWIEPQNGEIYTSRDQRFREWLPFRVDF